MQDLTYRQQKIQEKRKLTPWRTFLLEIASRYGYGFYKNGGGISRFSPSIQRIPIRPQ
jgi:hypothetical protein